MGGSALGLGAATAGLTGCAAGDNRERNAESAPAGRLFNGVSQKSGGIYPFDYKEVLINGRRIHYVDEGEGPVVMLVHGQGRATGRITSEV